ncbi:hypothetical protein D9M73_100640 [compost metagenome]
MWIGFAEGGSANLGILVNRRCDHRQPVGPARGEPFEARQFRPAGHAPTCPEVDDRRAPSQRSEPDSTPAVAT